MLMGPCAASERGRSARGARGELVRSEKPGVAYRLVAFDVDGTLVGNDEGKVVWELLNRHFCGDDALNRERFAAYRAKTLSYEDWVSLDVRGWIEAGATLGAIEAVITEHLYPIAHAQQTLAALEREGVSIAIISGTIDLTLRLLFPAQQFTAVHTNKIHFDEGGAIVGWEATPYDMEGKACALEALAQRCGVPLSETAFVGDNVNDCHVLRRAGLGVAFEPKADEVRSAADAVISDLRQVLPLLGMGRA